MYQLQAENFQKSIGLKFKSSWVRYGRHFYNDKNDRHIFKITLSRNGKRFTFNFGQSIAEGSNEPTLYDVLVCLQKYDVGTFEDFCGEFGYDEDSRTAERVYKAVVKEFEAMQRLFTEEELEILQIIE